jgi:hypothetical protein
VVYNKEQKGPVSALDAVHGFLVTAIGQKVTVRQSINNIWLAVLFHQPFGTFDDLCCSVEDRFCLC